MGTGPATWRSTRTGRNLLVANCGSGSVAVLPVAADGRLGAATERRPAHGQERAPERQQGRTPTAWPSIPANRFAFVCDLGLDKVLAYRFDAGSGQADAATTPPSRR